MTTSRRALPYYGEIQPPSFKVPELPCMPFTNSSPPARRQGAGGGSRRLMERQREKRCGGGLAVADEGWGIVIAPLLLRLMVLAADPPGAEITSC